MLNYFGCRHFINFATRNIFKKVKILIIEDEKPLRESIQKYMEYHGYVCETAENFLEGKRKIQQFDYDCIVVDIGLPYGNGMDIIRELKSMESKAGIIVVSAKNSLEDKLTGLESGSDDYITKPFHLSELNARISAVLRRRSFDGNKLIAFNEIKLDSEAQRITVHNKAVDLTEREYRLLEYFIINRHRLLTKQAIAAHVWGDEYESVSNYDFIYTHMKNLRKKLLDAGSEDYIKTVYRSGYRFTDS